MKSEDYAKFIERFISISENIFSFLIKNYGYKRIVFRYINYVRILYVKNTFGIVLQLERPQEPCTLTFSLVRDNQDPCYDDSLYPNDFFKVIGIPYVYEKISRSVSESKSKPESDLIYWQKVVMELPSDFLEKPYYPKNDKQ